MDGSTLGGSFDEPVMIVTKAEHEAQMAEVRRLRDIEAAATKARRLMQREMGSNCRCDFCKAVAVLDAVLAPSQEDSDG